MMYLNSIHDYHLPKVTMNIFKVLYYYYTTQDAFNLANFILTPPYHQHYAFHQIHSFRSHSPPAQQQADTGRAQRRHNVTKVGFHSRVIKTKTDNFVR